MKQVTKSEPQFFGDRASDHPFRSRSGPVPDNKRPWRIPALICIQRPGCKTIETNTRTLLPRGTKETRLAEGWRISLSNPKELHVRIWAANHGWLIHERNALPFRC
ncbi:hypothetical protein TNCV_3159341 [Trichonephila clavipes]|nr:hypothetical protein TNCV_3159341 [Trichonephila clavipes]